MKKKQDIALRAAALQYRQAIDTAPRIVAKGRSLVAEQIITLAKEHGVPITEDPALLNVLYHLEVDDSIPDRLYAAVAEVLAHVYTVHQSFTAHALE